ncbi:hypothetical protein [uncultured Sphingomonas sp.]|uniref:hypothetical protein n=1 Tax=uncultured Sphingomonas sp. TaxID=158754 RepID=UPI0025EF2B83|nr:hypothetical protein [uncultured Sphingomonas sp.]
MAALLIGIVIAFVRMELPISREAATTFLYVVGAGWLIAGVISAPRLLRAVRLAARE